MSNYADPDATRPVDLGACRCPGTPHSADSADVVGRFGYGELGKIRQAGRLGGPEAFKAMAVLIGVKRWTLVLPDGKPRPIDAGQVSMLDEWTIDALIVHLDEAFAEDPLPNAPGAPSPDGPSESASPTPTIQAPESSTST
ncbi:MAG: hypothetical protein V4515_12360 [Chloroflexota bacterium]